MTLSSTQFLDTKCNTNFFIPPTVVIIIVIFFFFFCYSRFSSVAGHTIYKQEAMWLMAQLKEYIAAVL